MKPFKAGETNILVYHLEDGFHATQASCTHVFAPLGRGNWANFPPGIQLLNVVRSEKALKTYRAVVEDGEVVVEV